MPDFLRGGPPHPALLWVARAEWAKIVPTPQLGARKRLGFGKAGAYHRAMTTPAIDIDKLDPEERLRLIGDLWESLRAEPGSVRLTPAQTAELDRRLDEFDRGTADVVTWDEAKRRLRG